MTPRKLIFEKTSDQRKGFDLPPFEEKNSIAQKYLRTTPLGLPQVSELEVIRHYIALAQENFSIEKGLYPLGSCTMKYNPKVNDKIAALSGFSNLHPFTPSHLIQGALQIYVELEKWLCELSGLDAVTLIPAAGAQGEFTGLRIIRAYHEDHGLRKTKILIPDSAHGTNPASATLCGYEIQKIPSGPRGYLDEVSMKSFITDDTAAMMITNPNTLGLFEEHIVTLAKMLHEKNAFLYCDGANFNALIGKVKMKDLGVDVMQFNLHKTFSTPHGGGGPGAGPVGVIERLRPYLPTPRIIQDTNGYQITSTFPKSIGRIKGFYGNFLVLVRAYAYMKALGQSGLTQLTEMAVLNANYIKAKLKDHYALAFDHRPCMHEVVFCDKKQEPLGVTTLDIAKRLMDFGFHPPTIYFPLIVHGAMMIEPTESESKEELDRFCDAMRTIAQECIQSPEIVKSAPHTTPVKRVDEVRAARALKVRA